MDSAPFTKHAARLRRCRACTLVNVAPLPSRAEIRAIYDKDYFRNSRSAAVGYEDYVGDRRNIESTATVRMKDLERQVKIGSLLDVGGAYGFFATIARARGWKVETVDLCTDAVSYSREHLGLSAFCGELSEYPGAASSFDLVTLWDVLEHFFDPRAALRECHRLLKPGGIVSLTTPDVESLVSRALGERWMGYKDPREHLYYFSRKTLRALLENSGFRVTQIRYTGKWVSLGFFFRRLGAYIPFLRALGHRLPHGRRLADLAVYVNPFDIVQVTARKR